MSDFFSNRTPFTFSLHSLSNGLRRYVDTNMISDCDDFYGTNHPSFSWGKVTRRIVDPVTFVCYLDVTSVPRIEDCSYETTNIAISHPRFGEQSAIMGRHRSASPDHHVIASRDHWAMTSSALVDFEFSSPPKISGRGTNDEEKSWRPPQSPRSTNTSHLESSVRKGMKKMTTQSTSKVGATKNGTENPVRASLGVFFSKAFDVEDKGDADNQSVGNRSFGARSISDRSNAELSKAEMNYKLRMKSDGTTMSMGDCRASGCLDTASSRSYRRSSDTSRLSDRSMLLIAGSPITEATSKMDIIGHSFSAADDRRVLPNPTVDEQASGEHMTVAILRSCIKSGGTPSKSRKLDFLDELAIWDIPTLGDKEHYRDWESIWYDEEELAEFRYEAFMEEAGLNVEDYA